MGSSLSLYCDFFSTRLKFHYHCFMQFRVVCINLSSLNLKIREKSPVIVEKHHFEAWVSFCLTIIFLTFLKKQHSGQ